MVISFIAVTDSVFKIEGRLKAILSDLRVLNRIFCGLTCREGYLNKI